MNGLTLVEGLGDMSKIVILGESPQSFRYLLGVLDESTLSYLHVPAREPLTHLEAPADVIIVSDYPSAQIAPQAMNQLVTSIQQGAGLIMIGGWTSFTGSGGNYGQTPLAALLPVICAADDDRRNVASGLWLEPVQPEHPLLAGTALDQPPVVCGYNEVRLAPGATLVANGRLVTFVKGEPRPGAAVPLLAAWSVGQGRAAALMTDLTPHWCGGIVDWGNNGRLQLPNGAVIGPSYRQLVLNCVGWAAGSRL